MTRYHYVDFAAAAQPGFRNHVVTLDAVAGLVAQHGAAECYASIFCFADEILLYLAEHRVDGRPSIAGYDGRVWAPFLPLDIDAHPPAAELADALELARRTYRLLVERWAVAPAAVHPYFSGAKGFHILIDTRAFGRVAPARDLHRVFSRLRLQVLTELPDAARPLFDLAIGDKVRLLRLPNTRHASSGLYKVALTADELLTRTVDEIRSLARAPRPLPRVAAAGLLPAEAVGPVPRLVELFESARRALRRERGPHSYRLGSAAALASLRPDDALCAARLVMWQSQIRRGNRNNVAIRLASAFRLAGYTEEQTRGLLLGWNRCQGTGLPEHELRAVVQSAYARPYPYNYGCHDEVIRTFCPYVGRLSECDDYRERHPRSGSNG
ncbi:MAG TPA: primase C-terminal domain-containing protein [Candidatus Acidoferrales bacterium]|nr:primase C-terminal domain-containing protein [Candidatus Acidoferrales bacterium]